MLERLRWFTVLGFASLTLACSGDDAGEAAAPSVSFDLRQSVHQLHLWNAAPGLPVTLTGPDGATVTEAVTDELGSLVLRELPEGEGYRLTVGQERTGTLRVYRAEELLPERSFYAAQRLKAGTGYITTRDGTTLAVFVTLPGPEEEGPYPTVVNYSGYDPARPGKSLGGAAELLCGTYPVLCDAPSDGSALLSALMGYATVSVNMRGTGCSGGAYDFFEELQLLDGYDVIETVAAQPWVLHGKVGMTGLSYPGIAQLFVAKTRPPGLAAITPLSVIGNTVTTLVPGGILNDGFALNWGHNVWDRAAPYGQGWEREQVDAGDAVCEQNQLLHGQRVDIIAKARATPYADPKIVDPLNPTLFAGDIEVPVFLTGSWQDEQTGPFFTTLLDRFGAAPVQRFTVFNGIHPDGFGPQNLVEWKTFLDLYVAQRVPSISPELRGLSGMLFEYVFGIRTTLPPDRFAQYATHAEALAAFEAEQPLRVLFESGAGDAPGAPVGTFEQRFAAWPVPGTTPLRLFFQPDGSLASSAPTAASAASEFDADPEAGQRGILAPQGNLWDPLPAYDWRQPAAGRQVAFESAPFPADHVMIGTGSVDLWVRSNRPDADLEVNLSEVRPDGKEVYVQSGWLRASQRKLTADSTELWPVPTQREQDVVPLPSGQWSAARIAIAGFAHVFRSGSRLRVTIDTPGDSRAEWRFALLPDTAGAVHAVAHDAAHPSSVVLPLVPGVTAPAALPPCPSLRGQPCRDHVVTANRPAAP